MSEQDFVVHDSGGSGTSAVLASIILSILLATAWYLALGPWNADRSSDDQHTTTDVTQPPAAPEATPNPS